jgi:hypothetical protein
MIRQHDNADVSPVGNGLCAVPLGGMSHESSGRLARDQRLSAILAVYSRERSTVRPHAVPQAGNGTESVPYNTFCPERTIALPIGCRAWTFSSAGLVCMTIVAACLSTSPVHADWRVHATRCTGEEVDGTCIALNADTVEVQSAGGGLISWPRAELVSITALGTGESIALPFPLNVMDSVTSTESPGLLILPNDDRLVISSAEAGDAALIVEHAGSEASIPVPWESIACWIQSPQPTSVSLLTGQPARTDRMLLSNGDLISGELAGFSPEGLTIKTATGALAIVSERIAAVSINSDLTSLPSLPQSWAVLQLTDGSRLTTTSFKLQGETLQIETQFGAEIDLPVETMHSMQFYSNRVVSFSSLPAVQWTYEPFVPSIIEVDDELATLIPIFSDTNLLQRANPAWNRSPLGGPLRIRGAEFSRGIGMRPRARLTFDLDGEFQFFQAVGGVDDRAQGRGSVEFRVESGGELLWFSPMLTGKDEPLSTGLIDVGGRDELTLVVDFAEWGDLHDLAVWGNPILIRGPIGD